MIYQANNEVEETNKDFSQVKRRQDKSFDLLSFKMERLKKDFMSMS